MFTFAGHYFSFSVEAIIFVMSSVNDFFKKKEFFFNSLIREFLFSNFNVKAHSNTL